MLRIHDSTIYLILGNHKFEIWVQRTWHKEDYFLKIQIRPTWNLWFQKGIFGFIFLSEWIIWQAGFSYEKLTPQRMEEVLKEINEDEI